MRMTPDRQIRDGFGITPFLYTLADILHGERESVQSTIVKSILYYGSPEEARRHNAISPSEMPLVTEDLYGEYGLLHTPETRPLVTMPDLDVFFYQVLSSKNPDKTIAKLLRDDKSGQLQKNMRRVCTSVMNQEVNNHAVALVLTNPTNPREIVIGQDFLRAQITSGASMALWTNPMMYCNEEDSSREKVAGVLQYEVLPDKTANKKLHYNGKELDALIPKHLYSREIIIYDVLVEVYTFPLMGVDNMQLASASELSRLKHLGFASLEDIRKRISLSFRFAARDILSKEVSEELPPFASVNDLIQKSDAIRRFVEGN
jgi:hypothetical protein